MGSKVGSKAESKMTVYGKAGEDGQATGGEK